MKYLLRYKRFRRWVLRRIYQSAKAERERALR